MLSASTSIPSASISAMRSERLDHNSPGASSGWLITAAASGTMVWAWISTVLTRLPLTTTSRRLPGPAPGPGVPEAFDRLHPTNARPAKAPVISSPGIGISVLLDQLSRRAYYSVDSVGEPWLRHRRDPDFADGSAGERQAHRRTDQRQRACQNEGGVEAAGRFNEVAGHDRREQPEGIAAEHQKREGAARIGGRAQQIAD